MTDIETKDLIKRKVSTIVASIEFKDKRNSLINKKAQLDIFKIANDIFGGSRNEVTYSDINITLNDKNKDNK
jgi:hypothetical protein